MNSKDKSTNEKYNSSENVYNPSLIESKWQAVWEKEKIYSPNLDVSTSLNRKKPFGKAQGKPFYNLMMFPYPSAEGMHVGNMYAFAGADVYGRFQRMQGNDVFEPIGLDGFGIHSENYAIKAGKHPVEQAKISEKNYYKQLHAIGNAFDWTRTVETYKPEYYKWTQWLFIQLFKAGLAYRRKAPVNFCPSCKTVLADEQVLDGNCERCETEIIKKDLEQWFFKITKYANRLLENLEKLDWSEKVKIAQRQWIGKTEGALIRFKIKDLGLKNEEIEVFTTRADTLYGATFLVLAPEHPVSISVKDEQIQQYIKKAKEKGNQERLAGDIDKTGVFSGLYAINPINDEKIPVWIADYALMDFGTGALFGDAHDERDVIFAKKYGIPLKPTLKTGDPDKDKKIKNLEECFTGYGILVDSGEFNGLTSKEAIVRVTLWLEKKRLGRKETTYHLRDWLISRQRYWGPPIPMIYCEMCEWQPVPEKDLPVELPYIEDYKPLGTGQAPLASHPEFYKTKCPKCGMDARRETDVSDTFLDSSWYFLRYLATEFDNVPFDKTRMKKWLPVNMYIGGTEHSVLHLLYSRFITMVLKDLRFISFEEPFAKFRAHGLIVKDGAKMSKSRGNVVIPDKYVKKFGADTLRTYLMFMGPFNQGGDFKDTGIEGMHRFLKRIWSLAISHLSKALDQGPKTRDQRQMMHKTIKKVTEDIEGLNYNTAIAALMEWYNYLKSEFRIQNSELSYEEIETFIKLLAPFAPHISEELYQLLTPIKSGLNEEKDFSSIHNSSWPTYDLKFLVVSEAVVVVQVNGKLRGNIKVKSEKLKVKSYIEDLARNEAKLVKYLEGKEVQKVIYIEGKVINFVAV